MGRHTIARLSSSYTHWKPWSNSNIRPVHYIRPADSHWGDELHVCSCMSHLWLTLMSCSLRWPRSSLATQPITFRGSFLVSLNTASKYPTSPSSFCQHNKRTQAPQPPHIMSHVFTFSPLFKASGKNAQFQLPAVIDDVQMCFHTFERKTHTPNLGYPCPLWCHKGFI